MRKILKHSLVIILLLPLLFLNIKSVHDWGDDFAQYLLEAKNIKEGRFFAQSGFVMNPNYVLGPNCYPPGFPIIIALTSFKVSNLNIVISFFLVLTGYLSFLLFSKWFHFLSALVMSLAIAYNPLCIEFKNDIASDLPFVAFVLLFFILYLSGSKKLWLQVLSGFFLAFAIEIRYVGWILMFALITDIIFKIGAKYFSTKKIDFNCVKHETRIAGSAILFYGFFFLLFPQRIIYYPNPKALPLFEMISTNADYNYETLKYFFSCFREGILDYIVPYAIVFTALAGLLLFIFKENQAKPTIFIFFFIEYSVSILFHQYSNYGFRMLMPVIPLILFFTAYALLILASKVPYQQHLGFCLGLVLLFCYKQHSLFALRSKKPILGPYSTEAASVFYFIRKNTSKNASIMFAKPRALTYFTDRKTFINTEWAARKVLEKELGIYKPDYFLVNLEATDDSTKNYFENTPPGWRIIFNNRRFLFFEKNVKLSRGSE
jgi:hypothetical protein